MAIVYNSKGGILTDLQAKRLFTTVDDIIDRLPSPTISQLFSGGYKRDMDKMLETIIDQTEYAINFGRSLDTEKLGYVDNLFASMDENLRILSYNYFNATVLSNFNLGWRNLEWGNLTQLFPWSSYLCSRGSGKCLSINTLVVMADGSLKKIQDIKVGDKVMGQDFKPRNVLMLHRGKSSMYEVRQVGGMDYTVSEGHLLCLSNGSIIPVEDAETNLRTGSSYKGYRVFKDRKVKATEIYVSLSGYDDYYGFACDGDHKFLLEDGTVVHNSYMWCYSFPLWRLYSYARPMFYGGDTVDNKNRKETAMITNTMTLAKVHVNKIIEEITTNDILKEKLDPNGKAKLGETAIEGENGAILHVRGKDGFIRGLHVGAAIIDDMPDESSLYSDEQREKLKEVFRGTITPIVEPYGYLIVSGTPYSTAPNELYNVIKGDKRFYSFEYPIVFPDGRPLAPDRYTFEDIKAKRTELGSIVFAREYLVIPISDNSTIFPYEYLRRSTVGMDKVSFADSIEFFPFELQRVVVGCDFAVSGNIGADYTVYSVWGIDYSNNFYLINYFRAKGMSHNEQVDKIVLFNRLYKPDKIVCEANGFQGILSALARERGLSNIEQFTTTEGNKKDLYSGLPSLSAMFERGQIKVPYKEGETRQKVELMFSEFASVTFRSDKGKLEASSGHDDTVLSSWLGINTLREENGSGNNFSINMV